MMLTPNDLDNISQPHEQTAGDLEDLAWAYVVKALADAESNRDHSHDQDLDADDWRQELIQHADDILRYVHKHGSQSFKQIIKDTDRAIATMPLKAQESNEARMESFISKGLVSSPRSLAESQAVTKIVQRGKAEADHYLGLAKRNMPKHAAKTFKSIVSDATLAIKNGNTPREALAKASQRWAQAGVPALVDSAGRRWHPDTYLRMVIQTQVQSVTNDITVQRSRDYTGLVKVSSHAGCRPTHLQYQGNVYSVSDTNLSEYPDLNEATNFGSAGGLCGINCHHYVMTYVPGYDVPDIDTLDPKSNNERYQLTQTQRRLEREVRAAKRQQLAAKQFDDEIGVANARRLVAKRQAALRHLTATHSDVLRRDFSREKIIATSAKLPTTDFLKSTRFVQNITSASEGGHVAARQSLQNLSMRVVGEQVSDLKFLRRRLDQQPLSVSFDEASFYDRPNAIGVVQKDEHATIHLNPSMYKDDKTLTEYVSDSSFVPVPESRKKQYPVVHELAHVFHNEMWKESLAQPGKSLTRDEFVADQLRQIYNIYRKQNKNVATNLVSKYASDSPREEFAELFVAARIGYNSKWAEAMRTYLKGVK